VSKSNSGFLLVVALKSSDPAIGRDALSDLLASNVLDQIARVPGVGSTQLFGGQYAMNIWLNPDKLHAYGLSASRCSGGARAERAVLRGPGRRRTVARVADVHRVGVGGRPLHQARGVRTDPAAHQRRTARRCG
jgi:hypothetical protein